MMINLSIIYRMCDGKLVCSSPTGNRCFNVSKNTLIKKCLLSLKTNIEKLTPDIKLTFYCMVDNCSDDIISYVKTNFPNVIFLTPLMGGGNADSFCSCVIKAVELPDDEIVYFLEDDYLFLNDQSLVTAIYDLIEIVKLTGKYSALMLDDYPDRYENQKIHTDCIITHNGHYLKIDSTTCTFMMFAHDIKLNLSNLLEFKKWPNITEDYSVNLCWKNVPLYQPIPAKTLHCQAKEIIPIYINFDSINNYFINTTERKIKQPLTTDNFIDE